MFPKIFLKHFQPFKDPFAAQSPGRPSAPPRHSGSGNRRFIVEKEISRGGDDFDADGDIPFGDLRRQFFFCYLSNLFQLLQK